MRFFLAGLISVAVLVAVVMPLSAEEKEATQTLALLPFAVDQAEGYAYLEPAVRQMLVSRLSRQEQLFVIMPTLSVRQHRDLRDDLAAGRFAAAAERLQADWLVTGEIVAQQDGVHLALTLFPDDDQVQARQLDFLAADADAILPAVSELSVTLSNHLLTQPEEVADVPPAADDSLSAFQTPHPERDFKKGLYSGVTLFGEGDDRFQSRGVRRSAPLPMDVESMALGDLDGDGINDLIVASRSALRIFHFQEQQFQQVAAYNFTPGTKVHVINIGDPGDTGTRRLFVSANNGRAAASEILRWDGSETLQPVQRNIDWYIRPLHWPGRGEILLGQQPNNEPAQRYLAPGVFELSQDPGSGRVQRVRQVDLPTGTNLFDFVVADFNKDGRLETVVVDERHRLLVYDDVQSLIWVSRATYGGSLRFFGPPPASDGDERISGVDTEQAMRWLAYIPGRLEVKDITGDGTPELVIVSNEVDLVSKYLPNLRSYDGGSVACLSWRGAGFMELWRTSHISGYVADYAFEKESDTAAVAEEGLNRLYVAQLPDKALWRRFLPGADNSRILAYEMRIE